MGPGAQATHLQVTWHAQHKAPERWVETKTWGWEVVWLRGICMAVPYVL